MASAMEKLPIEIQEMILWLLPREEGMKAALVCRRWSEILCSSAYAKECLNRVAAGQAKSYFPLLTSHSFCYGLDQETWSWRRLPSFPCSNGLSCLAYDRGLLLLVNYAHGLGSDLYVENTMTGECNVLPPVVADKDEYCSYLCAAKLEVSADGQSFTVLGACKAKYKVRRLGAKPAPGPAKLVRYHSTWQSWESFPTRCTDVADVWLTPILVKARRDATFHHGRLYMCVYSPVGAYLMALNIQDRTWHRVCELGRTWHNLVSCGACLLVLTLQYLHGSFTLYRLDHSSGLLVFETDLTQDWYSREWECQAAADGDCLCVLLQDLTRFTGRFTTYNMSTKEWQPWRVLSPLQEGASLGSCGLQLG